MEIMGKKMGKKIFWKYMLIFFFLIRCELSCVKNKRKKMNIKYYFII